MITAIDKITALVLIDFQNHTIRQALAHPVSEVLANAVSLIKAFRNAGLPVVIVNVDPFGAAWTKTRKDAKTQPPGPQGNEGTRITEEIEIKPGDIRITKQTWNAFYQTRLHDELKKRNVTGIVLGGISTHIGVEGTARAASELGYNISFALDAMTDTDKEAHAGSLKYVFPRLGEAGATEEIIEKLTK
jgi:nicotinamidase-related amidase